MTTEQILNQWAKFSDYDPHRTHFNLLSQNYAYHRAGEYISRLLDSGYDPTATVAVLYAKRAFESIVQDSKISVYDVLAHPNGLRPYQEMWEVFHSEEMLDIQKRFCSSIDILMQTLSGKPFLPAADEQDAIVGERMMDVLMDAVSAVTEELTACKVDVYQKGGPLKKVTLFNRYIQVFNTMADGLIAFQAAADGLYLCYIACDGTADGYFAFLMKNNGNLLSVNERVDEECIEQHASGRNNRWTESKKFGIFPYNLITGTDFDYKGYARRQIINEDSLDFSKQVLKDYLPTILGMYLICTRFQGDILADKPTVYLDTLLPANLNLEQRRALVPYSSSALISTHASFSLGFSLPDVLSGKAGDRFDFKKNEWDREKSRGGFSNGNQIMVDLWGAGFQYHPEEILLRNSRQLPGESELLPPAEFVGDEYRMQMEAYRQIRKQLASYIRQNIFEEYVCFGGLNGILSWLKSAAKSNEKQIFAVAAAAAGKALSHPQMTDTLSKMGSPENCAVLVCGKGSISFNFREVIFMSVLHEDNERQGSIDDVVCPITGAKASIFIRLSPKNWVAMENLLGTELPKILKGWKETRLFSVNPLLFAVDEVEGVGTPIERDERIRYGVQYYGEDGLAQKRFNCQMERYTSELKMQIVVGLSKRGLSRILKGLREGTYFE